MNITTLFPLAFSLLSIGVVMWIAWRIHMDTHRFLQPNGSRRRSRRRLSRDAEEDRKCPHCGMPLYLRVVPDEDEDIPSRDNAC